VLLSCPSLLAVCFSLPRRYQAAHEMTWTGGAG